MLDPAEVNTWAARNPTREPQSPRLRPRTSGFLDASSGTKKLKNKNTKESFAEVQEEVNIWLEQQEQFIKDVKQKFGVDEHRVKKMIVHSANFASTRAPSLTNAIRHYKSQEVNRGKRSFYFLAVKPEIQRLIDDDPELSNPHMLSKEHQKELLDNLADFCALKEQGPRSGNRAAAIDAQRNIQSIVAEIKNLYLRTGVCCIAMFARSHTDDTTTSFAGALDDTALKFFPEILKLDYMDVVGQFEMYACLEGRKADRADTLLSMRAECTSSILDGLRKILVNKNVKMNYVNYETTIVETHHVHLVGWPARIPFASPSKISTMDDIRLLRATLSDGKCRWEFLTAEEQKEHAQKLAEARAKGLEIGRKRKERSDKGKKKNLTQEGSRKTRKTSKGAKSKVPPQISPEHIESDEDNEQSSEDSEESD
ncbi:hypothetical protein C0991_003348 [Blastosporella zonata]|nr:hypothetical protein C0991_003348 [Blastosporella zonata]